MNSTPAEHCAYGAAGRGVPVIWKWRRSRMFTSRPIGFVRSPYKDTSQVPRGLGAKHEADGALAILREFEPGLTDIEGFSHLVVLWGFCRSHGFELLGTPPSDNRAHGVFGTRSPRRPNPIGLTIVELLRREGLDLHVRGVDMLDGTPLLDIKPLLSGIAAEKLRRGWLAEAEARRGGGVKANRHGNLWSEKTVESHTGS